LYSGDLVFREVRGKSEPKEFFQTKKNCETMQFELRNEEDDLDELTKSEEEVEQ
jgi:hypothetical protein